MRNSTFHHVTFCNWVGVSKFVKFKICYPYDSEFSLFYGIIILISLVSCLSILILWVGSSKLHTTYSFVRYIDRFLLLPIEGCKVSTVFSLGLVLLWFFLAFRFSITFDRCCLWFVCQRGLNLMKILILCSLFCALLHVGDNQFSCINP
jgi:hypothetical protein